MEKENNNVKDPMIDEELTTPLLYSVEEMVEQSIGHLNWMQIWQTVLISAATFFDSQQSFMSVFTQTMPQWHCTETASHACHVNKSNLCDLPKTDWAWNSGNGAATSVISEFGLECATSFVAGLPTTFFFIGCLVGVIVLPTLGDSYLGRKNLTFLCSLIMCLAAFASAFAPSMWVYSLLRFISGVGRGPIAVCVLVLLTERVGKRWRGVALMISFFALALGPLTLAGTAYLTQHLSWRILYLTTSIPGLIFTVISYFFLYESPRWLFMQGRNKDAIIVLSRLGRSKAQLSYLNDAVYGETKAVLTTTDPLVSLKTLVSKKWAVKRLLLSIFPTFGIGLVYFGLLLGVENLGYNIYFTTILDALLSLSTALIMFLWWIKSCNRRRSLLGFCTIGGVLCMILSIIDKSNEITVLMMQLLSLFCAVMACNLVLMYTVELFPTCVRNSASSIVRLALVLGSIFVPTLNLLGRKNLIFSYGVFGLVMFLSSFLFLCLPETRGKAMCDTMEEQEFMDNDVNICE